MKVRVKVFAALKDHFDPSFEVELSEPCRVEDLAAHLQKLKPESAPTVKACRFALGDELAPMDHPLASGDEIFVLPPSSGG